MNTVASRRRWGWLWTVVVCLGIGGVLAVALGLSAVPPAQPALAKLYAEEVPSEGAATVYGVPLAWENAHAFALWYDTVELTPEEQAAFAFALDPLRAPCCDDNPLAKCCCERGGLICNVVRTARGLGKYLVREGYTPEDVTRAMDQWLRFVHGDYYVARALVAMGENPMGYGLFKPENGACYRGQCSAPLRDGGCGGMERQVIVGRPKG